MAKSIVSVRRVTTEQDRKLALRVLRITYRREKQWVRDEAQVFPETDLDHPSLSWFLASVGRMPAGVIRVMNTAHTPWMCWCRGLTSSHFCGTTRLRK